ncbi:TPA: hydrolase [Enterococcus faecalis]|nr:hydrolase [Enterococcus faecalis]
MSEKWIPEIMTPLKQDIVKMPEIIRQASGIKIFGRKIKSIIFTTDIAIIRNTDAQAVIAVYPFTPHPAITKGIIEAADIPVFSGVGGGLTQGMRSAYMSLFAEAQGSMGVVLNGPTPIDEKLAAGVDMINISAGKDTAATVRYFRGKYPELPIIATGGPTESSIHETIIAGANAITYTPPSNGELFSKKMKKYREQEKATDEE